MNNYLIISLLVVITANFGNCQHSSESRKVLLPEKEPVVFQPYSKISFKPIKEASGLVKSRHSDNVFWTHNDGGDEPRIFPITRNGNLRKPEAKKKYSGTFIKDAKNKDWEDIATDNEGNLIIGDCGNNKNKRKDLALYIIEEPIPSTTPKVKIKAKIRFYYPDQQGFPPENRNFDGEAIFWARGKIYLLTKHRSDNFTKLYRFDSVDVEKLNPLTLLSRFEIHGQVTAADASIDGKKIAVLTYSAVWLFEMPDSSDDYFAGKISWLPISANQCEAICFDGDNLLIANEQRELFKVPLNNLIVITN